MISFRRKQGFTLVELIVTLAILVIILGFIFGFLIDNMNRFDRINKLSQVQFDVRMAGDFITSELRNVDEISKSDTAKPNYIDLTLIKSKYPNVKQVKFWLNKESEKYFVQYEIQGSDEKSKNQYQLVSKVLLNNISLTEVIPQENFVTKLYFKKLVISVS